MRDNFSNKLKRIMADRAGHRCSNPKCTASTSGPSTVVSGATNLGVAAHITAASPRGPRFDDEIDAVARSAASNAIWLCQNCAKLVDNDPQRYTRHVLRIWKQQGEGSALANLGRPYTSAPTVSRQERTILTPDLVRQAYAEIELLETLPRNSLALAVARGMVINVRCDSTAVADAYVEAVLGRLESTSMGGRSATLGALLYLLHPDSDFPLDPQLSDKLLASAEHALTSDSFLQPEIALLVAGFVADRMGTSNSACFDFVERFASSQRAKPANPRCIPPATSLLHWIGDKRAVPLRLMFPLSALIPAIQQDLPSSSAVLADEEGAYERAMRTAKKPSENGLMRKQTNTIT